MQIKKYNHYNEVLEKKTLDVYICDQIKYISKEDFIKYVKVEPKIIERSGDIEIVPIAQTVINKICKIYGLVAQLYPLKTRERKRKKEDIQEKKKSLSNENLIEEMEFER